MLAKTPQGKEMRKYYVKLENINNKIISEQLKEQAQLLVEKEKQHQIELQIKEQEIQQLENKPETEGFIRKEGFIYMIKDTTKNGHIKIGFGNPDHRAGALNVGSSTQSLEVLARFTTFDIEFAEKIIHLSLFPFKIQKRKEWYSKSNLMIRVRFAHFARKLIFYSFLVIK